MKIILLTAVLAVALASRNAVDKIVDEFDFDALLSNPEDTENAIKCFVGKKDCGELEKLKEGVLCRLQSDCGDCDSQQREKHFRVRAALKEKYPEYAIEIEKLIKKE